MFTTTLVPIWCKRVKLRGVSRLERMCLGFLVREKVIGVFRFEAGPVIAVIYQSELLYLLSSAELESTE